MLKLMSVVPTPLLPQNKSDEAEKLLKQLLECVQDCQKRFGGKTELATEYDSCTAGLCFTLEAVLLFGLKDRICQNSSTIKQVSDILITTPNTGHFYSLFWMFIYCHLTKHERERYTILKHIWTDTGRGRAWIRSSLNEHSLERYFHTILSNSEILAEYYEPWSILRDEEKNSMLPNMAAGLNCILFAVSIDKPELNSGVVHRRAKYSFKAEPVIEAPLQGAAKKNTNPQRKRKVARQFISFDDSTSEVSSSVQSSSSSADSLQSRFITTSVLKNKFNPNTTTKTSGMDTKERKESLRVRKLSLEIIGSGGTSSVVPDSLTPVLQEEIGELTPVSVNIKKVAESLESSDEIEETPTDISAVLSAIEDKNKEELNKKQEKVNCLMTENESLKRQLDRYISAIQMLNCDKEVNNILENLDIEHSPNYKMESKMYEKKLVQVAEMHAELMDFNAMLQENLCKKELMLEKVRSELESLKVLNSSMDFNNDGLVESIHIWIPSAFLKGSGSNAYHVYQIFMRAGRDEWNIYRRYAQFHAFHTELKKLDPIVGTFDFPPKKSLGKKDSCVVEDRRKRLQIYLRKVIAHWPELANCNSKILLEQQLPFFKDQREDLLNRTANSSVDALNPPADVHLGL